MQTSTDYVFDFKAGADISDWQIEDDRVMGGISQGKFELNEDGHGMFHGNVTVESNGGFSSVQNNNYDLEVAPGDVVSLRVKGDGHDYNLRVKDSFKTYYSYSKSFKTNGDWQTITIKLSDMAPTYRGRDVNQPNFDKNRIVQMRFLIGTKKVDEPFKLLIDKIEVQRA
jgi:hypothetical protein